jgi:hypothetical protein
VLIDLVAVGLNRDSNMVEQDCQLLTQLQLQRDKENAGNGSMLPLAAPGSLLQQPGKQLKRTGPSRLPVRPHPLVAMVSRPH